MSALSYTVAVPVHDGASTIAAVLAAAAAQQPPPAELLVADDGSRDDSAHLASAAGARVLALPPVGLAATRNALLAACHTEVILFFDADAVPRPGCAAALLAPFTDPRCAAAGGQGVEAGAATFADRWRAHTTPQSHGPSALDDDWMVMGLCAAFRVEALRKIGGFDERFRCCGEDVEVSLRLRAAGGRLAYRPEAVVDHARSDGAAGVLAQAYRHSREAARAMRRHGESTARLERITGEALRPALRRDLAALDAPATLLTLANLIVRRLGLRVGSAF